MWERLAGRVPSAIIWVYAILSALIPLIVYNINQALHRYGDPPWKKK